MSFTEFKAAEPSDFGDSYPADLMCINVYVPIWTEVTEEVYNAFWTAADELYPREGKSIVALNLELQMAKQTLQPYDDAVDKATGRFEET